MSREEHELWTQVTGSIDRAGRGKPRVRTGGAHSVEMPTEADGAPGHAGEPLRAQQHPTDRVARPQPARPIPQHEPPKPPRLAEFDRRKARRLAAGQVEIDARLDLHGLRQGDARHRLIGFIHGAQSRGHRTILVITGKGSGAKHDPLAAALGEPQRGVLRRLVPQWLESPELRSLIVSFTTAAIRHGGEGALYVHLRRPDRV